MASRLSRHRAEAVSGAEELRRIIRVSHRAWKDLVRPCDIYIDHEGVVYVPELDGLITLLNLDGQVLTRWWSPTTTGAGDGGHAVWVDSHGDLYLNQNQEGRRLLKYRRCS